MIELINKWDVVNKLISLENEFQHYKPFEGFEHAMYRKLCEVEIEIGKMPGTGWIPVTERLPEEDGYYLCCVKSFSFPGRTYINILRCDKNGFQEGHIYTDDVTHWMPLPEPPSESTVTVEDECNDEDWGC